MKYMMISLTLLSASAFGQSPPEKTLHAGTIRFNPCQDAKVLADCYSRFGAKIMAFPNGNEVSIWEA